MSAESDGPTPEELDLMGRQLGFADGESLTQALVDAGQYRALVHAVAQLRVDVNEIKRQLAERAV